mgnify:CR=1 FL=1
MTFFLLINILMRRNSNYLKIGEDIIMNVTEEYLNTLAKKLYKQYWEAD